MRVKSTNMLQTSTFPNLTSVKAQLRHLNTQRDCNDEVIRIRFTISDS